MHVVHRFPGPGLVELRCSGLVAMFVSKTKITAIRLSKLTNKPATGS